jgi:hypothetical protein
LKSMKAHLASPGTFLSKNLNIFHKKWLNYEYN